MNIDTIQTAVAAPRTGSYEAPAKAAAVSSQSPSPTKETNSQSSAPQQIDKASLEHAVKRLSDFVASTGSDMNFSIDENSGIRVVKIVDRQSREVIRQIPSEEAVQIAQALDKLQGLFVKDKA